MVHCKCLLFLFWLPSFPLRACHQQLTHAATVQEDGDDDDDDMGMGGMDNLGGMFGSGQEL